MQRCNLNEITLYHSTTITSALMPQPFFWRNYMESMGALKRTHSCNDLGLDNLGQECILMGWVLRRRDHGGVIFIDLRDRWGITQVVFNPEIDAVNTVGCGDSMIAGFALGLSEGLSVEETLKKASAISAAAALREETGFFVKEDMEKIYPQVEIEKESYHG